MKPRINVYLDDPIADQLALIARRPGANKSAIVNAALDRFFNPEPDNQTAALIRRLDRMTKALDRLDRNTGIGVETLALFIRYFLTVTPPLPADDQAAAHALGRERFEMFVAQVGRRLAQDGNLLSEVLETIAETRPDLFAADSFTMDRQQDRTPPSPPASFVDPDPAEDDDDLPPLRPVIFEDDEEIDPDWFGAEDDDLFEEEAGHER